MPKNLLDTNLIIRFLLNDDPKKADAVGKLLRGKKERNVLPEVVMAEIIWVLSSYYQQTKPFIIDKMRALIHVESVECNQSLLDASLTYWERHNISFIDSYLLSKAQKEDLILYTYDRKLTKISGVESREP